METDSLVIPRLFLPRWLEQLSVMPEPVGLCRLGRQRGGGRAAWLARDERLQSLHQLRPLTPALSPDGGEGARNRGNAPEIVEAKRVVDSRAGASLLEVRLVDHPPDAISQTPAAASPAAVLYLGRNAQRGEVWTPAREGGVEHLDFTGPGMHRIDFTGGHEPALDARHAERWSRTIGAMGDEAAWRRLAALRVAVVGCGRTGSLVVHSLARLGIRQLTLVDPDRIERHNLGEMDLAHESDVGKFKALALAQNLSGIVVDARVRAVSAPLRSAPALRAITDCDVIFSCVDNDAARLAAGLLATIYHKVLVDIGTGVLRADAPGQREGGIAVSRQSGADVRLLLPGDGCLLCRGNLSRYAEAVESLCQGDESAPEAGPWFQRRAGSSRAVNTIATGYAIHLLQEMVAEKVQRSMWAHLELGQGARMEWTYPGSASAASACRLCALAGQGDVTLAWGSD